MPQSSDFKVKLKNLLQSIRDDIGNTSISKKTSLGKLSSKTLSYIEDVESIVDDIDIYEARKISKALKKFLSKLKKV